VKGNKEDLLVASKEVDLEINLKILSICCNVVNVMQNKIIAY